MSDELAFISYNPFTDQRIGPDDRQIYDDQKVPFYIHGAVARAKIILAKTSFEELQDYLKTVIKMLNIAQVLRVNASVDELVKGIDVFGDTGGLSIYYKATKSKTKFYSIHLFEDDKKPIEIKIRKDISLDLWPKLYATLALALAGEIVNVLWPSEEYLSAVEENLQAQGHTSKIIYDDEDPAKDPIARVRLLEGYAADALQAVSLAEGMLLAAEYTNEKKKAVNARHDKSRKIKDEFVEHYLALNQTLKNGGKIETKEFCNDKGDLVIKNIAEDFYLKLSDEEKVQLCPSRNLNNATRILREYLSKSRKRIVG